MALSKTFVSAQELDEESKIYPFLKISEGYSLPYVDDIKQFASPCWDITGGFSYEFFTFGVSVRSHFLASKTDSISAEILPLSTEGHTAIVVTHVEGKADVKPVRFVTSIDLGMIWFHEFNHAHRVWSRYKLPVIGIGADFRILFSGNFALSTAFGYTAAFEGFLVNAKAYNSINLSAGIVYDGGLNH